MPPGTLVLSILRASQAKLSSKESKVGADPSWTHCFIVKSDHSSQQMHPVMFWCYGTCLIDSCSDDPSSTFTLAIALVSPHQALLMQDAKVVTQLSPEMANKLWTSVCKHAGRDPKCSIQPMHIQSICTMLCSGTSFPQRDTHCISCQHAHYQQKLVIVQSIPLSYWKVEDVK